MSEIRYRIPLLSAQAILAYAKINERFPDRYTVALNKRETESTVIRGGETYQADNAIFYQAMCAIHNYEYTAPIEDTVIEDLYDVIAYVDFKGIFDCDDTNPKVALRQTHTPFVSDPYALYQGNGSRGRFSHTVSMKTELFRPDDLPLGWEHSPAEEEREWLTKTTEQRYYDLCANDYFRQRYFISRAERWSFRKKSKNYRMAQILKKNPFLYTKRILQASLMR